MNLAEQRAVFTAVRDWHGEIPWRIAALATNRSVRTLRAYAYGERRAPVEVIGAIRMLLDAEAAWHEHVGREERNRLDHIEDALGRQLQRYVAATVAMCQSCEPDAVCRQADCPLRAVSPLPLVVSRRRAA